MNEEIRFYVGIDRATEEHVACAVAPDGAIAAEHAFKHSGDGLGDLVAWIERLSGGNSDKVAVAIEVPHGAVVETLLEHSCQVFAINPKQLDRFRDRFSPAGSKDDRRDAYMLGDSLRTDQHCFRQLKIQESLVIELREWSRIHDELDQEKKRLANRFRDQLRRYFPQYLEFAKDAVGDNWFLELWNRIPTPEQAKRVRSKTVNAILRTHRIRRISGGKVLEVLRQRPLTLAPGTEKVAVAHIRILAERLEVVNRQIRECRRALDVLIEQMAEGSQAEEGGKKGEQRSDVEILRSVPGVGRIVVTALLAEAPEALQQRNYQVLRVLSGVAPVTQQSGKKRSGTKLRPRILMRRACVPRLRYACYHWARVAVQHDARSRQIYSDSRHRGHSHGRALRGVADRLLAVACSMLSSGTLYDPQRWRPPLKQAAAG